MYSSHDVNVSLLLSLFGKISPECLYEGNCYKDIRVPNYAANMLFEFYEKPNKE